MALPPLNRVPRNISGVKILSVEELIVGSWGEKAPKLDAPTEVHILIKARGLEGMLLVRLDRPDQVDTIVEMLQFHRAKVWPTPSSS